MTPCITLMLNLATIILVLVFVRGMHRNRTAMRERSAPAPAPVPVYRDPDAWRASAEPLPEGLALDLDALGDRDPFDLTINLGRGIISPETLRTRPDAIVGAHEDVTVDFASEGHLLVVGNEESGKSSLAESILCQWVSAGGAAVWCQPDRPAYAAQTRTIEWTPGVLDVATGVAESAAALARASTELDRRYALLKAANTAFLRDLPTSAGVQPLLVVLDDATDLMGLDAVRGHPSVAARNAVAKKVREHVRTIARLGRAAGVHLVLTSHRADVSRDNLDPETQGDYGIPAHIRDNLEGRVLMGAADNVSRCLAGFGPNLGATRIPDVKGRGCYGRVNTDPLEVQVAQVPDELVPFLAAGIPASRATVHARAGVTASEAVALEARREAGEDIDPALATLSAMR